MAPMMETASAEATATHQAVATADGADGRGRRKRAKSGAAAAAGARPPPPPTGCCSFWLPQRARYCSKPTPKGHSLCCNHGGGDELRVPCPVDPRQ